jgi:hypothetical protein
MIIDFVLNSDDINFEDFFNSRASEDLYTYGSQVLLFSLVASFLFFGLRLHYSIVHLLADSRVFDVRYRSLLAQLNAVMICLLACISRYADWLAASALKQVLLHP